MCLGPGCAVETLGPWIRRKAFVRALRVGPSTHPPARLLGRLHACVRAALHCTALTADADAAACAGGGGGFV
ncbi:uncharacterized protein K452DRAFT_283703, partial [Aplosporella prunicola CBS 121167]